MPIDRRHSTHRSFRHFIDNKLIVPAEEIGPAVRRAQASGRPTCLNIMTDPDVVHPNIPVMIGRLDAEDEIPIPYYENIPIRR
jgi:hypothetical protein